MEAEPGFSSQGKKGSKASEERTFQFDCSVQPVLITVVNCGGTQVPVHDAVQTYNKLLDAVPDREKPASDTPLPEGSRKWYDRGNEAQEELWRHCT